MNFPAELKYTKDHEWIKIEGDTAIVGITEFAQRELGDIALLLASASGTLPAKLREHFTDHFAPGAPVGVGCQFCKLQGRVLAAEGHRRLREEEHSRRAIPAQGAEGAQSEVRRVALGLTAGGQARAKRDAETREAERKARAERNRPRLGGKAARLGSGDTTDVWF